MNQIIDLEALLKKYFHFDHFQTGQRAIIHDVINGEDVLGILPTGSGKSLCYQLPAKILPGITIVVSPLISLMIDQVRQVKAHYYKEAVALHSFYTPMERKQILTEIDRYKLIFISPELLQQSFVMKTLKRQHISLFVVDEAHCISQWGYDFRPDYLRIPSILAELNHPSVLALTGSATEEIQTDIMIRLQRPQMKRHIYSMERENIALAIEKVRGDEDDKQRMLLEYIQKINAPTIIYFSSRKRTEEMTLYITQHIKARQVAFYHGGMKASDRLKVQQQFMNDQVDIICCTSAFGMGINKANIRFIIHYHLPTQLESFVQEIGRAGRDGKQSISLVLYKNGDINIPSLIIDHELPAKHEIDFVFSELERLYLNNQQPPLKGEQAEQQFQITETKWRFLHYQFEQHQVIKDHKIIYDIAHWERAKQQIVSFCGKRLQTKKEKLHALFQWVQENGCLRKKLYQTFQRKVSESQMYCCQNCGFTIDTAHVDEPVKRQNTPKLWEQQLHELLLQEHLT